MKILVISNLYPPHYLGGYEILCAQVCQELYRRGHTITVLTSDHEVDSNPEATRYDELSPFTISRNLKLYIPFDKPGSLMRRRRRVAGRYNNRATKTFISDFKPDVVFIWSQLRLTLGSAYAGQESRLPIVYTLNDEHPVGFKPVEFSWHPRRMAGYLIDRFIFTDITIKSLKWSFVTCISQRLKDNLLNQDIPIENARIIYQAIPIEKFPVKDTPGLLSNPLKILFVGQLNKDKGVHTLISAADRLCRDPKNRDFTVTIAGTGPDGDEFKKLAAESNAEIRFLGRVPYEELPALYRSHDIFVFPSIWQEPFGLTPLEAMASGTTVVSTVNGGHGEFIEDRKNALVFEEGNIEMLTEKLALLFRDQDLSTNLASTAREEVVRKFSMERYVDELESLLTEALQKGESPCV